MSCLTCLNISARPGTASVVAALVGALAATACIQAVAPAGAAAADPPTYELVYTLSLQAGRDRADARIRLGDGAAAMRELRLRIDPRRHTDFDGDGQLQVSDDQVIWRPPPGGGALTYVARIGHRRNGGAYDARVTDNWALFRGGDVFPPASTRTLKGARSRARLILKLPDGWSSVTPYAGDERKGLAVQHGDRRFDRPTGWILAGRIGVRRATIAGTRVAVAAPRGEGMRRMDILALLHWSLPGIRELFPAMDERLAIVGAGDPMWRGGLSGPGSLFIHADRPLISENGTSTLLHELVHVAMGVSGDNHDDWVVEGLAEYYSIRVLHRSGTLGPRRMAMTLGELTEWGSSVDDLFVASASGPVTARATVLMAALDRELAKKSGGAHTLDEVLRALVDDNGEYSYASLCQVTRTLIGELPETLHRDQVPGAPGEC